MSKDNNFRKFPSIEQFKNVIHNVRQFAKKHDKPVPTLSFEGTVKLHGTNGGIGINMATNEIWAQSRERTLSYFDDNAGFCKYMLENETLWRVFLSSVTDSDQVKLAGTEFAERLKSARVVIFGEWCGPGIQKGVAISEMERKAFFPFELKVYVPGDDGDDVLILTYDVMNYPELATIPDCYRIGSFQVKLIDIDFNAPQESQNELVDLTLAVEERCPVAFEFQRFGVGEGIVWTNKETGLRFKVKGEKHSTSKVSTVKQIAAVDLERMKTVSAFVDNVVTDNRLNQGIDKLRELGKPTDITSTGDFIKWIIGDVQKEEMDVIIASNLDKKELMPAMSNKAKEFYLAYIKREEAIA
jgi:hypothetical protein